MSRLIHLPSRPLRQTERNAMTRKIALEMNREMLGTREGSGKAMRAIEPSDPNSKSLFAANGDRPIFPASCAIWG